MIQSVLFSHSLFVSTFADHEADNSNPVIHLIISVLSDITYVPLSSADAATVYQTTCTRIISFARQF